MQMTRQKMASLLTLSLIGLLATTSCQNGEPEGIPFTEISHIAADDNAQASIKADLIARIDAAQAKIDYATYRLTDTDVADALVRAYARGVNVRVVTDSEAEMDDGVGLLQANNVPVIFGDGEIKYLPDPTLTSLLEVCFEASRYRECTSGADNATDAGLMVRPDNYNLMSDNFVVIDELEVLVLSAPIGTEGTLWFGWQARSQDIAIAFTREFQQLAGGVFATTLSIYNGPIKSTVHGIVYDSRLARDRPGRTRQLQPGYLTDRNILKIEFNPQQRLSKEIIDEIYTARGSVFLMTDQLLNSYVVKALTYKARAGFDVRVIVRSDSPILNDVRALSELGDIVRVAPAQYTYLPTVVITDESEDRNGDEWPRTAMVLSHTLMNVSPFQVLTPRQLNDPSLTDDVVRIYPADLYADGTMWTLREFLGQERESSDVDGVVKFWLEAWGKAAPPT